MTPQWSLQGVSQLSHQEFISRHRVEQVHEGIPTTWTFHDPLYPSIRVTSIHPGNYGIRVDLVSLSKADEAGRIRAEPGEISRNRSGKVSKGGQFTDKEAAWVEQQEDRPSHSPLEPKDYKTTGDIILQNPKLEDHEFNKFVTDRAGFRDRVLIGLCVVPNTSVYPNVLPGLIHLNELANKGDRGAAQILSDIAKDHPSILLSGIDSASVSCVPLTGVYEGVIESSLRSEVEFDPKDRDKVLAAIARFATNFNQHQIHLRDDHLPTPKTKEETVPGHRY